MREFSWGKRGLAGWLRGEIGFRELLEFWYSVRPPKQPLGRIGGPGTEVDRLAGRLRVPRGS